ncbi:MAG: hypothetical protein ACK5L3_11350, partial [Oscillospiraceae bacterium]
YSFVAVIVCCLVVAFALFFGLIVLKGGVTMTVIKKSGRIEEFSDRKLASSIKAANEKTE